MRAPLGYDSALPTNIRLRRELLRVTNGLAYVETELTTSVMRFRVLGTIF